MVDGKGNMKCWKSKKISSSLACEILIVVIGNA